ncbi:MAG: hypothetical protein OXG35_33570 [Acidobacteria bacterium]|nr:hypothetical protein [Acidobacteriota bacterium]
MPQPLLELLEAPIELLEAPSDLLETPVHLIEATKEPCLKAIKVIFGDKVRDNIFGEHARDGLRLLLAESALVAKALGCPQCVERRHALILVKRVTILNQRT